VKEEVKEIEEIKGENVDEKEIRINKLKASTMMSLSDPIEFGSHDSDINEDLLSEEMKPSTIEEELKNVDEDEQLSESIVDSEKIPISEYEFTLIQFIELLIKYPDGQDNKEAFQLTLEYNTNEGKKEKIVPFSKSGYVFPGIMFLYYSNDDPYLHSDYHIRVMNDAKQVMKKKCGSRFNVNAK